MGTIKYDFRNEVVVITGAATGIGRGTALAFAKAGASVAVCDFNREKGEETVKLCAELGAKAAFYQMDVTNEDQIREAKDRILNDFGTVDVLFSNAGIAQNTVAGPTTLSLVEWEKVFAVNVLGTVRVCSAFAPVFKEKKRGKIVITSSIAAYQPSRVLPAYSASKIASANYAQSLSLELGEYNVNVNVVNPGYVYTPIYSEGGAMKLREAAKDKLGRFETGEQVIGAIAYASSSLHRMQTVEDIANLVMFLSSDAAKEITGQIINIDSGVILR